MEKTIVFIEDRNCGNYKHSAWNTKQEALKQIKVLKNYGYKNVYFDFVEHNYINGQYFV